MTAPKSFEWRGYVLRHHVHESLGDCLAVFSPEESMWHPIGLAENAEAGKNLCRQHARKRLADAQAELDRVMEGEDGNG